ncbi:hypothetical protein HK102_001298 [Quaeritorhiza haematococci]|nr:hypothetical protein HK102_001298 [Quaeritorhiza haematococci]
MSKLCAAREPSSKETLVQQIAAWEKKNVVVAISDVYEEKKGDENIVGALMEASTSVLKEGGQTDLTSLRKEAIRRVRTSNSTKTKKELGKAFLKLKVRLVGDTICLGPS